MSAGGDFLRDALDRSRSRYLPIEPDEAPTADVELDQADLDGGALESAPPARTPSQWLYDEVVFKTSGGRRTR